MRSPSLFESINARALTPEQVGESFVFATHFERLTTRGHTVMVGPRGSGKTTLLKMLQLPALEVWGGKRASGIRERIDFASVFIPTDLVWKAQIEGDSAISDVPNHRELALLGTAAFNNHILTALLNTVEHRARLSRKSSLERFAIHLDRDDEAELSAALGHSFRLDQRILRLSALRSALSQRMEEIGLLRRRLNRTGRFEPSSAIEDLIDLDFLATAGSVVSAVSSMPGAQPVRWALCFDELELCPQEIRHSLLQLLRSTDNRFLFKYAMSPYDDEVSSFEVIGSAQAGHDFEVINLTHGRRRHLDAFSRDLVERLLATRGVGSNAPPGIFGRSITADQVRNNRSPIPYAPGSTQHQVISRLAEEDPTFAQYLATHSIDDDVLDADPAKLHKYLRKVIHYIAIRDAYRVRAPGGVPRHNSLLPYSGVPLLYALCEGNPRLLIGVVNSMLPASESKSVSPEAQAGVYKEAIARLRSLLRTIGAEGIELPDRREAMPLLDFLDRIGQYFRRAVLDMPFTADPPGSFVVDEAAMEKYAPLIGQALNAGAIVHVSEAAARVLRDNSDLVGERFRLSYLLGAYHHLPLRLDRPVTLSRVMDRTIEATDPASPAPRLPGFESEDF